MYVGGQPYIAYIVSLGYSYAPAHSTWVVTQALLLIWIYFYVIVFGFFCFFFIK